MKRKSTFLRMLVLLALMLPWVAQAQNARVSEYDGVAATATYSSIAGTSGASAWTQGNYVDVSMPFAMYFGENQITAGSTLRVYPDGSASFTSLPDSRIAPLYYSSGYTTTATSIYTKSSASQLTVEWRKVVSGQNSYSFQLKLYPNGDIEFCYGPMTISSSINVLVGMMSSDEDIYRVGGRDGGSYWDDITRYTSGLTTRTISSTYAPVFDVNTNQGVVYTFTQPACVKPTNLVATSTADGATISWDSRATSFQIKYSTDADFDPATEGTQVTSTATSYTFTGLTPFTRYYYAVRAVCGGTPSAWTDVNSFFAGTVVNMGDVTTLTTCSAMIFDDGGAEGDYSSYADHILTITPATAGKRIRITGTYYTESGYDYLTIYDGVGTSGEPLFDASGSGTVNVVGSEGSVTIYFTSDGGSQYDGFALTAVCEDLPTCPNPAAPIATSNGVISWSASRNATSYDILFGPAGFDVTTSGTAVNGITGTTTTLTGLASATTYDVYLRAHCSVTNETSEWSSAAHFTTACVAMTLTSTTRYSENFESYAHVTSSYESAGADMPNCWNLIGGGTRSPHVGTLGAINGNGLVMTAGNSDCDVNNYAILPQFANDMSLLRIAFSTKMEEATTSVLTLGYVTDVEDTSTFVGLFTVPSSTTPADHLYTFDGNTIPSGARMAFRWYRTASYYYVNIDNVVVSLIPNCPDPSIASASAEGVITWVASNNATSYELKYGLSGFDVETEGTLVQNLTGTTHTLTGLASSTSYDVYIRAICSATSETSEWSSAETFTTACMPIALPYAEDFESYTYSTSQYSGATVLPACWIIHSNFSLSYLPHIYRTNNNNSLEMTAGTSSCIQNNIAVLPAFTQPLSNLQISFDCSRESANTGTRIFIGYVTDASDSTTFVSLTELTDVAQTFSSYEYSFAGNTIPAGARIALKVWRSSSYYWARFDNIRVEAIPTCVKPTAVEATVVTDNSATLTWTENNTATQWNVLYGPAGFDPETEGTTINANGTAAVTLNGLTANTAYDVYVQSVCAADDQSTWSNIYTFRTDCGTLSLPYREDFADYTGLPSYPYSAPSQIPYCWNYYSNGTNTATSPSSNYYGGVVMYSYTSSYASMEAYNPYLVLPIQLTGASVTSSSYLNYEIQRGNVKYAILPNFDQPLYNLLVSFDYKMNTAYSSTGAAATLELGYVTNGDTATFQSLQSYNAVTTTQSVVDLSLSTLAANAPAGARLAFKFHGVHNGTSTYSYSTVYCGIDNIVITKIPNCFAPGNVTASNVTNSTAVISWTERTIPAATNWTLLYGLAGFDPETEGTSVSVSGTPSYELTGLNPYEYYDVYVRADCSANESSAWSDVSTFRTICPDGGSATIGEGTTANNYGSVYSSYGNTVAQQIYTAEELIAAGLQPGNVSALTFTWTANTSYAKEFTIYMGNTTQSDFAGTAASYWVPMGEQTLVYGPAAHPQNTSGTVEYTLATPFVWDGESNIVVTTFMNQPTGVSQSSSGFYAYTTYDNTVYRTRYAYKDSNPYTEDQIATLSAGSRSYYRSNVTFIRECNTSVTCFAPVVSAPVVAPNNTVAVTWAARTDLRPVVNNFELKYGLAGFDPETSGTLVSNLNNVFNYNITEALNTNTNYDVYVRTVCDADNDDYSSWTMVSFTTYPSCWVPSDLAVSATTQNSVTLSWTENTPTAATRWEVAYGTPGFDPDRATPLETTNNSAFEITGLKHSTKYEFYVRAKCSETDHSDWSSVATGTTQCGPWQINELPFVENFDGVTGTTSSTVAAHVLPNCWNYLNDGTSYPGYPIAYNSASYSHSGNNHLRFYCYYSTAYSDQYAILPELGFAPNTLSFDQPLVVGFYARESSTSATYVGNIEVGVMTDPTDATTFEVVESVQPTTTSYEYFEVDMSSYTGSGRYIALRAAKPESGYNVVYLDDLTVKFLEKVNTLADNGETKVICNEYIMPDTTNGGYHGNLNATYIIRPAEAGKVAHITGSYNLENGYDYLNVYRGAANANNLVGRYTGNGTIDYMTASNNWVDSGYITLVFTTDADNAFTYDGFKLLVGCECPMPAADVIEEVIEANGTYTWRNGTTYLNNIVRTGQTYDPTAVGVTEADRIETAEWTYTNVAGCDSVSYSLNLTVHPTYNISYAASICERDVYSFYGNDYTTTGNYTVALTSQYGADSTGILNLQVNPAPTAAIYNGGNEVTEINAFCDNADLALLARSNNSSATFAWEDQSTAASRVVNPHDSNTYTVIATEPAHGCTSLPATLTVTTTPVPELSISGDAEICFGKSTTLTLTDANNVEASYRWSTGATGNSITVNPTETTTYTVTATTSNASACTATATFEVVVNPLPVVTATASVGEICRDSIVTLNATAVEGYSYSWNTGATTAVATAPAASTGAFTVMVTDLKGCQKEFSTSTVVVYPSYEITDELSVCYTNNPYTWGAQTITANGAYDQNFTIGHGCDSLVHLTFTFEEMGVENTNREVCEGTSVTWGTQTIAAAESTVLTYVDTTGECPVQMNLNLTVNHPAATAIEQTVCDSYTWPVSGETYTESGVYPVTLATTKGCDSIVTMNLTVNYQNTGVETVTACDNYVWDLNGVTYTESTNVPTFTLQNQWGCDSVVTLDLTVNYRSYHEDFHCVRDANSFVWAAPEGNGRTFNLNVDITDGVENITGTNAVGCNEIAQLHLVLNPVISVLNWVTVDTCDEFEIPNAVVFTDENDCQGHIEPLFLTESGDYEIRTRNNADVYGQDQTTRIHLTINHSDYHTTVATECLPFEWLVNVGTEEAPVMYSVATITADMVNGAAVYNMSYEMPQQFSNGCSRIEVLRLTPKYPSVETIEATICQNGSWTADNNVTYYGNDLNVGENLLTWDNSELNSDGCPLTKKVNLTVNPVYFDSAYLTFCESEFVLNAETGEYELTVADANHNSASVVLTIPGALNEVAYNNSIVANWQTALGCDSIVRIDYRVNPTTTETEVYTVCYKDNFEWDANGRIYSEAGEYADTVVVANGETGCELNRVLNLTVLGTYEYDETVDVCTSYEGPDGVTYRETRTFDVPYEGTFDETQYCDAITHRTYAVHQSALNHQYVVSNRPYTWKNGQTFSQSVENVYFDVPVGEGCDSVLALHFTMVDPITFCDDAFPYETGINNIVINTSDIVMDTASFCLNNPYAGSIGGPSNLNWGTKFEANRPNDKYKVYGAQLYYVGIPGDYSLRIYTGGDDAPATLVGTKTITFNDGEAVGWKYFQLDNPLNVDNSNLWVTFHGDDLGYPISCVQYYDQNDQNGAWVSTDGINWESLNSNNNELFYSFMIKTVYSANIWRNNDPQGNDTILFYTVNPTYEQNLSAVACDSYTWDGDTYTESGVYTKSYTSADGCDSVVTMNITINNSDATTVTEAVCDSYTWASGNDSTYTESGNYTWTTTNEAGCDSVVTLALTINVNEGVELSETACATYTWDRTGLTYTNNTEAPVVNDYTVTFTDANGCSGDSVLHLTLNPVNETNSSLVVNEAGSYTYLGTMYSAPFDSTITYTFTNQYGCDSIDHLHLIIPVVADDQITEVNAEACGSYTWEAPDGTGHTYEWIPMSERQSHGMAMYKDVTANQYVYTYPTDTTFDADGVMTAVRVLHLNLLEATYSTETLNVPASLGSYTIDGDPDDVTITFNLDSVGTPIVRTLGVGSVAYCNDYRTYTINIIDNYDTTEVYACADETTYEWNGTDYTIGTPGHTFWFTQVENAGTLNELVHVLKVNQRAINAATATATACDSYIWTEGDGLTYTTSGTYVYNYTDDNQCAASKTLNLTVNYNSNTGFTDAACDTYTWTRNNQTYTTSGDYTYNYNTAEGCASTDTLHLTINSNSNQTFTEAACNSYVWASADGGDDLTYTNSGTYTYNYTAANGCPSVNTLNLTINLPTSAGETVVACDSTEWNGTKYYVSGEYTYDYTSAAGCASTDTLHLTVNAATHNSETMTQCDSYEWNGTTYTASGDYQYTYTNAAGCQSVDTLHLTINVNTSTINDTIVACDEYTWNVNNRLYNASGNYTARTTDDNGCATTNTLTLTINHSSSYDSILYISDGSYRYTYQDQHQELFGEGVHNLVENYTNEAGCDSTLNITLNIGTAQLGIDNVVNCNRYTWRNGETYVYIDAAERAANLNADNVAPLYKTSNGVYVYYNPTYTVAQENNYDSIYMLALTLTQSYLGNDEVTLNISDRQLTYGNETFAFDTLAALQQNFVSTDKEFDVHFPAVQYCDSIITLTIHLVNNYQAVTADNADICVSQDSYTWREHTISTATSDYDNAHVYYIYDTLATGTIEYITVNQHPITYTTERRTACDSYEWYGNTYTESTTNATEYLPAGTVVNGETLICDRVATLILVINHNTSTTYDVASCENYVWTVANGGNGDTLTESGTYTYDYETTQGCPSTNTLNLTINHNTNTEYTVDACDSYTWTAEEGGNGTVYSTSSPAEGYTYDYLTAEGCPSTNTLHLTIRNNSNQTFTETACDTYTWLAADGGDGETYTTSGVYTFDYEAENGCPSTNTLNLTINVNSSTEYTVAACDSYTWNGTEYTVSGDYTYDYSDDNNCPSEDVLHLTVNNSTHNVETVVACQSYNWHGTTYSNPSSVGDMFYGTYQYSYVNENSCFSVDTLHLTLGGGRTFATETVTNCGPYTWIVNGEEVATLSSSVETSTSFLNPRTGCDSVVFLYLTVHEAPVYDIAATICDSELPYTWIDGDNTTVLNEAGEATVTYPFSANCDSTVRLTLTVNETKATDLTDQICLGNGYNANGFAIDAAEMPAAGEYTFTNTLSTVNGCDSVVTLTITVGDVINNPVEAVACDSYTWTAGDNNEYTFTESGVYNSEAYANAAGCTTVDVLKLTINQNAGTEYTETVCDGYMWNGTQYTESGDYTYSYTDGNGCASTDVLHLTVNSSVINTIEETACDSFTWTDGDGETYTASGEYTYNYTTTDGCNGTDYLVLTINTNSSTEYTATACDSYIWNDVEYTQTGDYSYDYEDANGCPSTDVLHLTVNNNSSTEYTETVCDSYTWNGTTYTESGDYSYDYINAKGCASTDVLHLTVNYNTNSGDSVTVCNIYNWHNVNYSQSGTYYHHYNTAEGCASVDTLFLTVNTVTTSFETATACDSYTWPANGETYVTSGSYMAHFQSANGCDSIISLRLTINNGQHNAETVVACDSYTWNGTAYTTSGTYPYNYTSDNGCASTDTLHLTINNSTTGTETAEACNFFVWNGQAYTQSGNYTQTLQAANGCDSVVTLNLTINTQVTNTVNATACGSYTWNGAVYTQTGSYTQNFSSAAGCDSVVTLNLTISPAITNTVNTTVCDSYTWNGVTYTTSGIYSYTYTAANGCDSIVNLALTVNQPKTSMLAVSACGNYIWNGTTYTTSGNYTHTTPAANGCDSIVTLALTINQPVATTISETTCNSYTWNGATYTTSGSYTHTYTAANGCDSVVTLNLTISPAVTSTISATACGSYTWEGVTYTTSGSYTHTYTAANGCDSIVTLNLTIAPSINNTLMQTACDSYTWNGNTYLTSGVYTHTYTTDLGCDSIVTLVLTVTNSIVNNIAETACNSYTWNGNTYTASGVFTETYTSANGCDSVVTLNLTVNQSSTGTDVKSACESYTWIDGVTYTASTDSPTFTLINAAGCDSVVTLNLTINHATSGVDVQQACDGYIWINGVNYTESTNEPTFTLTNANGCDSVVTLNLTINQSIEIFDTITVNSTDLPYNYRGNEIMAAGDYIFYASTVNGCDSTVNLHVNVNQIGIDVVSFDEINVYPNPTRGRVTISADDVVKVEVLDIVGRRVATFEGTNTFDISNLGEGAYTLRITLPQGVTVRKIVKK